MKSNVMPKAYMISANDAPYSEVVWAETAGKAKRTALDKCESMWDSEFTDLRARRLSELDLLYKGESVADWYDTEIRIELVSKYDWRCAEPDLDECKSCPAKDFCGEWELYAEEDEHETV